VHRRRSVDALEFISLKIGDDLSHAVNAAGAYGVEKLCGELGEHGANTAACDDFRASSSEKIRELPHTVEIRLQAGQENKIIFFCLKGIERTVPVFMVQTDIETLRVYERGDMKPANRLHDVLRASFHAARSKVRTNDKGAPLF
jgi:hypothetical protein